MILLMILFTITKDIVENTLWKFFLCFLFIVFSRDSDLTTIDWDQHSTEINNQHWLLTEINNLLTSTIDWDWQSTEVIKQLRLTIKWDQQLTDIKNKLILTIDDGDQQLTVIDIDWDTGYFFNFSTLAQFIATFRLL